jgi:hypothetical protein
VTILEEIPGALCCDTPLAGPHLSGGGGCGVVSRIRVGLFLGGRVAYACWVWAVSGALVCDGVDGIPGGPTVPLRSAS